MATSDSSFVGTIPEYYDRYLRPLIFEAYAADLARRVAVPNGGSVLEIAAGTGIVTRHLRDELPSDVSMMVTDLNQDMLDIASQKFGPNEHIELRTADATQLPFGNASFDAIVCGFSLMFFPDKAQAIQEAARVLKRNGTFVFNLWDSMEYNDIARVSTEMLAQLYPSNPPRFFETPYGYYRIDAVRELLSKYGFGDIEIAILPKISTAETARHAAIGYLLGTPMSLQLAERGPDAKQEAVNHVERALAEQYGDSPLRTKMQALAFTAHLGSEQAHT